jgi:DNA-binding NarL/FixJ family response regulator
VITAASAAAVALLAGLDLMGDRGTGASAAHLAVEVALLIAAAIAASLLVMRARAARREAEAAVRGVSAAIDAQFEAWGLTSAEREIGVLLLKGLSHKEIANVRETGEATVRQQALALYRKAQLTGRAELSAFFLEDLLPPRA